MKKLLLICPSRWRPVRILDLIKSVEETTDPEHTDLIVLLDKDDECVPKYKENLPDWVKIKVYDRTGDKTYTTEILNRCFEEFNDYGFYSITNDDIVYKTKGWDKALCQKYKISCGQDDTMVEKYGDTVISNIDPATFPITSIVCGDLCRLLGWIQYPPLIHSCGDNIWYWLGRRCNLLYSDTNYHTDHNSAYFDRGKADRTYKRVNIIDNRSDYYIYKEWLKYKCGNELGKVEKFLKDNDAWEYKEYNAKIAKEKELCHTATQEQ